MKTSVKHRVHVILSIALTVLMMLAALAWSGVRTEVSAKASSSGNKASLSRTSITMETSGTAGLKVRSHGGKKVKWSSSDSRIVKISSRKGKYSQSVVLKAGKKAGKCTIKAKVGKKTLKCRVTVKKPKENEIEIIPLSASSKDLTADILYDPSKIVPAPDDPQEFGRAVADFSVRLLQQTRANDLSQPGSSANTNILVSPDSVLTALMMAENGADGKTLSEMQGLYAAKTLPADVIQNDMVAMHAKLTSRKSDDDIIYDMADSIWAHEGEIDPAMDFLQKNKQLHNAQYYLAPFSDETVADMNNWVYNNTRNMIRKIISDLNEDSVMVLINAIAFEGKWAEPFFDSHVEKNGKFTDREGNEQKATMLNDFLDDGKPYVELAGGTGFVKMYQGGKIAFMALLPPETMDADEYLNTLTGSDFVGAWEGRSDKYDVRIKLPEFKYDYGCSMKDTLAGMGMREAFTDDADFSKMVSPDSKTQYLKVSDVLHKTHIELDRNGTKAAAATAIIIDKATAAPDHKEVVDVFLDRPFVYALVDTGTGIPLFIGMVNNVRTEG